MRALTRFAIVSVVLAGATAQEGQGELRISVSDGRLTLQCGDQPIEVVLYELTKRTQVHLEAVDELSGTKLSAKLEGAGVEDGIRRLLADYDVIYYHGAAAGEAARLRAAWVYPKGGAIGIRPMAPGLWASGKEIAASLASPDAAVRERAYLSLLERPDAESREKVLDGLRGSTERDDSLRERLLQAAVGRSYPFPAGMLTQLARSDGSETIRWMALDALAMEGPAVRPAAEAALGDASEAVRERAKEILASLSNQP